MAISILMTAISAVLVTGLDRIVYSCSGEDACIMQIDFAERQIRYMKYDPETESRWMTGQMSGFMTFRLKFAAAFANAPLWLERYEGKDKEEADAWCMDMYFGNRVLTTQGVGEYPLGWKMLISKIMDIAEVFEESAPPVRKVPYNVSTADI